MPVPRRPAHARTDPLEPGGAPGGTPPGTPGSPNYLALPANSSGTGMALSYLRVRVHEYEGRGVPAPSTRDAETAGAVRDEQVDT
ncbi:hypothetical protein GCM10014713_57140 [Streptomyces purpureus]|uniref:Uncharacterized protein n=1 Tax=Streptomyces purpureus TaxID=1951 RepID=A0A918HDB0_9ACTN|nr:hypothetical protein GCM10014713_57140 [Streptomyces purpureus]